MDDTVLYRQVKAGDEAALETLIERYHRPLFGFLYRLSYDRALADDLAQETFIRVLNHRGETPRNFRAWVFTIARNLAHDHFRSGSYRREEAADFSADGAALERGWMPSPENVVISADGRREIAATLQNLPPEQREVVILRFYHDMALNEIAEITETALGTVKSRLFHALKKLKVQLEQVNYE